MSWRGQVNLLEELEFEKSQQTSSFHKRLLITAYVPGPQANNPPANKADNILRLPESSTTLVAIVINTMIITTIATSWRKNWEGQAGKGKFQEATHNNLGGFLKYRTQGLIAAKENPSTVPIRL